MTQYIKFIGYLSWVGIVAVAIGFGTDFRNALRPDGFVSVAVARDAVVAPLDTRTTSEVQEVIIRSEDCLQTFLTTHGGFILEYSKKLKLDYRLVLAVIKQESGFDDEAVSHRGAYGFMQVMPRTFASLEGEMPDHLAPEQQNLYVGMNYLRKLIRSFSRGAHTDEDAVALALAAYNAGPTRVRDAQEICRYRNLPPGQWSSLEETLPVLSAENEALHDSVWSDRPPSGRFGGSAETLGYVEKVMVSYHHFKRSLPAVH